MNAANSLSASVSIDSILSIPSFSHLLVLCRISAANSKAASSTVISSSATNLSLSLICADHSNHGGSDSDTSVDEVPEYYQPISPADENDDEEEDVSGDHANHGSNSGILENGHCYALEAQSWISSLHLNGVKSDDENQAVEEEEDEVEVVAESSNSAVVRAFREDENRRNAPLTPENTTRVMEAMRGISFGGSTPDWAGEVPETQWIDRLRRLRQMPQP